MTGEKKKADTDRGMQPLNLRTPERIDSLGGLIHCYVNLVLIVTRNGMHCLVKVQ